MEQGCAVSPFLFNIVLGSVIKQKKKKKHTERNEKICTHRLKGCKSS